MKKNKVEKFLEFNGKRINVLTANGQWWVAIKPICEVLGIDYEAQRKNLKDDEILSELPSNQTVVAADGKAREMLCLPERFIYGWLFSVRSDSPGLAAYKRECYEVLYNHFHQPFTERLTELTAQVEIDNKIRDLQQRLTETDVYKEIEDLKRQRKQVTAKLRKQDRDIVADIQLKLELN